MKALSDIGRTFTGDSDKIYVGTMDDVSKVRRNDLARPI